jgi:class 3 adenylate cyclase/tetratricopeptide (TPR) repeat protein
MGNDKSIAEWLASKGLGHLSEALQSNGVELDVLAEITAAELAEIGVSLGDRKRLLKVISELGVSGTSNRVLSRFDDTNLAITTAERRQITVLFCDLVGSSQLLGRLDPEDSRDTIRNYRAVIAGEVEQLGGHVAQFLGDGILAYFGWPHAYEDAASRAVSAAVAMTQSVAALKTKLGEPLAIRIGIATGLVVVGGSENRDMTEDLTAVGGAVNVAARLQDLAKAGQIFIAQSTQHLVASSFSLESRGVHPLKGIAEPVHVFAVAEQQPNAELGRQKFGRAMLGRDEELRLALSRWNKVKSSVGQVLLISGEAGIGKSHMTERLVHMMTGEGAATQRFICSPFQQSKALHPALEQLRQATNFARGETAEASMEHLLQYLGRLGIALEATMPYLLRLLSVNTTQWPEPDGTTPMVRKARGFAALNAIAHAEAKLSPLVLIVEDAHWIDPTTLEFFEQLLYNVRDLPVLIMINARPDFRLQWQDQGNITSIVLQKIGRAEIESIIATACSEYKLPDDVVKSIVERSDGVPLFVEELTKAVMESGFSQKDNEADIPSSLRDTLMARLDRIPQARDVAQIAACIGRECDHELLAALSDKPAALLEEALEKLAKAEILFRQGMAPQASYRFKHALVQEAAVDSLLKSKRRGIHLRIARYLEESRETFAEGRPELLAHHFTQAEDYNAAIEYRQKAGQMALAASGNAEAIGEFGHALELVTLLPSSTARDTLELNILIAQAIPFTLTRGYAAPEVEAVYRRAMETSARLPEEAQSFAVIYGFWRFYLLRGDYANALQLSEQLLRHATTHNDTAMNVTSNRAAGATRFYMARYEESLQHLRRTFNIVPEADLRASILSYDVVDPWVVNHAYAGTAFWIYGQPSEAIHHSDLAIALARQINHPFTLALALCFGQWTHQFNGDLLRVHQMATEALALSNKYGFTFWTGWAEMMLAWADQSVDRSVTRQRMRVALQLWQSTGSQLGLSYFQCLLAEQSEGVEATLLLDAAEKFASEREELFWMPEIYRLRGKHALNERYDDAQVKAEASFRQAMTFADTLKAQGLGLRAACDLTALLDVDARRVHVLEILKSRVAMFLPQDKFPALETARSLIAQID